MGIKGIKMKNLQDNIIGITIGIKFNRSFRMSDISGDIIDNILYSDKTPFGTDFFPKVQTSNSERTLFNPETSEYLRVNTDDIILGVVVDNNFKKTMKWLNQDVVSNYFGEILFRKYAIKNIRRIGIVFSHKISKNKKLVDAVSLITENSLADVNDINISFSKKIGSIEALYRKDVNDYKNTIYNFQDIKEAINCSLDYQYYFDPVIEDLRDCFIDKIFDDSRNFLEKNYYQWLLKYDNKESK